MLLNLQLLPSACCCSPAPTMCTQVLASWHPPKMVLSTCSPRHRRPGGQCAESSASVLAEPPLCGSAAPPARPRATAAAPAHRLQHQQQTALWQAQPAPAGPVQTASRWLPEVIRLHRQQPLQPATRMDSSASASADLTLSLSRHASIRRGHLQLATASSMASRPCPGLGAAAARQGQHLGAVGQHGSQPIRPR